jgi:hypothetical protein
MLSAHPEILGDMAQYVVRGFHFTASFMPRWTEIVPVIVQRARTLGFVVSDNGAELEPRAKGIALSGTHWLQYRSGGIRFDILEYRKDTAGAVIAAAGVVGRTAARALGLENARALQAQKVDTNMYALEHDLGLWINQGTLMLLEAADGDTKAPAEVVANFDLWSALDDISIVARGEPLLSQAADDGVSRGWAPTFKVRMTGGGGEARATCTCPQMAVTVEVALILE